MRRSLIGIALIVVALTAGSAWAEDCYGVDPFEPSLHRFDATTGVVGPTVTLTLAGETVDGSNGISRHPLTGDYYAVTKLGGQFGRQLVTVDPDTGVCTSVGDTGDRFAGLAFDAAGTLYGVTGDGANTPETLWTVSTVDGTPTLVLALGAGADGEAIGYNPDDGLIYHMSGLDTLNDPVNGRILEAIDPIALTITPITITSTGGTEVFGMKYRGGGEFLISNLDQELWTVTTTGVETFVTDHTESAFLRGIAPLPPAAVPTQTPTGLWVLGASLALVIAFVVAARLRPRARELG